MDYSNTNLSGKDLLSKKARRDGLMFKIKYIKENIGDLRLIDAEGKHEKFVDDMERLIKQGYELTQAQIRYVESLFDKILG